MAVKLNQSAYSHAQDLVRGGAFVADDRDALSEHQASAQKENKFIRTHGFGEYGKWHLGVDDEHDEQTKQHYKFPYAILKKFTGAGCFRRKAGRDNINISI